MTVIRQLKKKSASTDSGPGCLGGLWFQPGRMGGGMDLLQLVDRDLAVNLGGREFGTAKELPDKANIRAT
jgi:hypothetical protein